MRVILPKFLIAATCLGIVVSAAAQTELPKTVHLSVDHAKIDVVFTADPPNEFRQFVVDWTIKAARAVATYYKQFPVDGVAIRISSFDGRGARSGKTFGEHGPHITISVGLSSTEADLAREWMMTHEMVHLAFPSVAEKHHWIEEGLATYVEPIARARSGELSAEQVWGDMVKGMPQGLPQADDHGLDFTHTWGNTYWGGARFCLLADIEIRRRTANKKGLEDALRAIVKQGGTIDADWTLERVIEIGDGAIGSPVLRELYDKMKAAPVTTDLDELWKKLGVTSSGGRIVFDDKAPWAAIRKAITEPVPTADLPEVLQDAPPKR